MVKLIIQEYKIVDKKETKVLLNTLKECRILYDAWKISSNETKEQIENLIDNEINNKIEKCYEYYQRMYNIEIEKGYGEMKDIEINISNICEKIKSWEK